MLRLTESRAETPFGAPARPNRPPNTRVPPPLPFDAAQMAERALNQAERRMENLLELVRRFDLDAPGEGPSVA
jgi:hypothetical protein